MAEPLVAKCVFCRRDFSLRDLHIVTIRDWDDFVVNEVWACPLCCGKFEGAVEGTANGE